MISNFELSYKQSMSEWKKIIKDELQKHKIEDNYYLTTLIYDSIKNQFINYLQASGFSGLNCWSNKNSINNLYDKYGLELMIRSNDTLWLYLKTFSDLTDYDKCFDIYYKIVDMEKQIGKILYIPYKNIMTAILHDNKNPNLAYLQGIRDGYLYYVNNHLSKKLKEEILDYESERFETNAKRD